MLRLFFIITSFSLGGGAEGLLAVIMNTLYDTGNYYIGMMELIHANVKREKIREGIKVYPYYTDVDAPDRQKRMYYVFHEWDKVIKDYIPDDYDVYISFNYLRPTFLLPPNKKSISWIHGDVYDLVNRYPNQAKDLSEERELQRKSFRNVDRILAISDNTKQSLEDVFPEYVDKISLLPNGVDVNRIRRMAEEHTSVLLEGFPIVFIGRLDHNKNPLRALRIIQKLLGLRGDARLYFLGYGALEQELRVEIKKRRLEDFVSLLGYYDNPFPIIRQASLTIMTSYSEGFPMALLESVALGVPFVSTIVGGSRMLCKNSNVGAVFRDDDEAVNEILRFANTEPNVIKRACENVISEYDLPDYIRRVERVINEVFHS